MAAIYRNAKDGEKAEEWEGIKFVSAIAADDELASKLSSGWVDHPLKLTSQKAARHVDKARVN